MPDAASQTGGLYSSRRGNHGEGVKAEQRKSAAGRERRQRAEIESKRERFPAIVARGGSMGGKDSQQRAQLRRVLFWPGGR